MSAGVPLRIDYVTIHPLCTACSQNPSEIIRVMQTTEGEVHATTFCAKCSERDEQMILDDGDLEPVESNNTRTMINTELYEVMVASGGIEQITEAVQGVISSPDHACIKCGKEDSETINGSDLCWDCLPAEDKMN